MASEAEPPDARLNAPISPEIEALEMFRRSPHPYLRHKHEIRKSSPTRRAPTLDASRNRSGPPNSTIPDADGRKRRKGSPRSQSPSESGTEADDEGYTFVKALPPAPLRLHKGLRESDGQGRGGLSPLLTPTQIDDEGRKYSNGYFTDKKRRSRKGETSVTDEEARAARQRYLQRRRNELLRRTTETALLAGIGALAVRGCNCWAQLLGWHRGETRYTYCTS
jgi:hypothetical protein